MSWITVLLATGVSIVLGALSIWLVGSLTDVVHWLESADAARPEPMEPQAQSVPRTALR